MKEKEKETDDIRKHLERVHAECNKLGLSFSVKHVHRMIDDVKEGKETFSDLATAYKELINRISDEVEDYLFFGVHKERIPYYKEPLEKFGKDTINKFPSIRMEVEETGKCYAVGRYTACAFHLIRVIEVGLRTLGKSVDPNFDPAKNPTWEAVLKKCDMELQKPYQDRSPEWKKDNQFFSEATANLRAVKDAWRNTTMHVEHIYDEERVLDLFNAVRAFMRHLAIKLSE